MTQKNPYALKVGEKGRERLEILNKICNPFSIAFLKQAGLRPGMSVLDIGCGTGIMSSEMAELVGPKGSVLGIDVSIEQINLAQGLAEKKNQKNVSFQELSVHELSQLKAGFDAIYARYILCHVTAVEQILKHAYSLLKPGGLIVCEDLCGLEALFCYPPNAGYSAFMKVIKAQFDVQNTDPAIGMKLPFMLSQAGFKKNICQLQQPILAQANEKKVFRLGVREVASAIVSGRLISEQEVDVAEKQLEEFESNDSTFATFFRYAQIAYRK